MEQPDALHKTAQHHLHTAWDLVEAAANIAALQDRHSLYQVVHYLSAAQDSLDAGRHPQWPHEPGSEQWTTRNGSPTEYLYLYWNRGRYGADYESPTPKGRPTRKTYVGCKPTRIALARLLTTNYRAAKHLDEIIGRAEHALNSIEFNASRQARNADHLRLTTAEALETELTRQGKE